MSDPIAYRQSQYLQLVPLEDGRVIAANGMASTRAVIDAALGRILALFAEEALTPDEARERVETARDAKIFDYAVEFLWRVHLIVDASTDEADVLRADAQRSASNRLPFGAAVAPLTFAGMATQHVTADSVAVRPEFAKLPSERLPIVLLGGCFTQLTLAALTEMALAYGLHVETKSAFLYDMALLDTKDARVIILQPSTVHQLRAIWDDGVFLSDEAQADRLDGLKLFLTEMITSVAKLAAGKLLLVQGFSTPQASPFGRTDFRQALGIGRVVHALNEHIIQLIGNNPNILFVDEERVLANGGKQRLMDDLIAPYSHHGPIDLVAGVEFVGPTRQQTFGIEHEMQVLRLLAEEYLDLYLMWSGRGAIKCVVVDLDNTLWPGVVGESTLREEATGSLFSLTAVGQAFINGPFGGLHQALKILKHRGILLASCSKGNHDVTMEYWRELHAMLEKAGYHHLLHPDDFAIHKINWERKSQNVGEIGAALGVADSAMLYLDDSSIEREEVGVHHPAVRVLGENMLLVRPYLLTSPCLQVNIVSDEARARTQMVRAQVERDAERSQAGDEQSFLRSLRIKLRVTRVTSEDDVPRITELIQRTNQFNTTQIRYDAQTVSSFLTRPDAAVYTFDASDRFADYGTVGVLVFLGDEITTFVVSCRVLALRPAVPFLTVALADAALPSVRARIVETDRNVPCRSVFTDAGFSRAPSPPSSPEHLYTWTTGQSPDATPNATNYEIELIHRRS